MILSVMEQGTLFLGSFAAGVALAFFYDIFRTVRRVIPHGKVAIHIEDAVFWIISIAAMFLFLLELNGGETRFFSIAGMFIGMVLYFYTISPLFMKCSLYLYKLLKKVAAFILSVLFAPFKVIIYFFSFPASFMYKRIKTVYFYEKKAYNNIKLKSRNKAKKMKNNFKIVFKKY